MGFRNGFRLWLQRWGVLASFAGVVLVGYAGLVLYMLNMERSERPRMVARDMRQLLDALGQYTERTGQMPPPSRNLSLLVEARLLERLPVDPWGHDYVYRVEAGTPVILSYGRDGIPDGEGPDADLSSRILLAE